jgi:hypothetical protein
MIPKHLARLYFAKSGLRNVSISAVPGIAEAQALPISHQRRNEVEIAAACGHLLYDPGTRGQESPQVCNGRRRWFGIF